MVTYKLNIYNKLNQNAALISFNLSSFNFVLTTAGTSFKTL